MYTSHGHQIPDTPVEGARPALVHRCGGTRFCPQCREDVKKHWDQKQLVDVETPPDKARRMVFEYKKARMEVTDTHVKFNYEDTYVVWFAYVLGNWKALVSTTLPDEMYYEVTFNGQKNELYLDAYKKFDNVKLV